MSEDIYDIDTGSVRRGNGIRELNLTDRWNTPLGKPNGGYILAAMLRGLGEEMEADDPLVAAITYLASPEPGPAELRTSALRCGRRVQTGQAGLFEGDRHVAQLVASFGPRTGGRTVELGTAPDLPDPDSCVDPRTQGGPGAASSTGSTTVWRPVPAGPTANPVATRRSSCGSDWPEGMRSTCPRWRSSATPTRRRSWRSVSSAR